MADQQIVTNIVAKSDFSNLIADVQRVTNSLSKLQQEFAGSNRALAGQIGATNAMFKETMLKTGQFSTHFVSLTSDVEKFGRNLDSGRLKLRDYFRVYQDHTRTTGGLIRDLAKQQVQLQNSVLQPLGRNAQGLMQYNVHIPRGLDLVKNRASVLKQELQIMNKVIQDGGVQLINWGKNTQWAGRQLTVGLTLPLAAFGKAAADAFKVADQELTRLTKVYGDVAGTSAEELAKVRKEVSATAKELSSAMGVNFSETISLAADIAATGKTGNELLSSVAETTRLAVLGEVDRQEAMKATLAIQSAFQQNTEELAQSINFLNAVENQTSTTLQDLVEAIPKAGPVIKGLGGSVQDLALYLTAMREGGINASEGANALKSALASLINPTNVAVEKFQGFGIDLLGIVNSNAGNVTETLLALQAALDNLDPLQKQQAIEQLFGKFQFSRLNALFENLGRQGSQTLKVLDLMKASTGELEAVAGRELAAVTESAAGRYKRAIESLKADLAGVGEDFLDIGTKLLNVLGGIIDFAQKLPDPVKKLMTFAGAFTAIIGPVIMLTGVLANFFGYIIKGLGHFKALFKGAEGFKLLTPEMMAAQDAGKQLGNEFYNDSKAAATLSLAIKKLSEDLILLEANARRATASTATLGSVMTTASGTPVMNFGSVPGQRVVDTSNPLLGGTSRAAAHLNPRDPNNPTSIFGLTMQPIPVNRKIGANPQILMNERLPDVPGLTTINNVSTGVVASEHARYAALMATLGVQSKAEIDSLKKIIGMGGQVSKELIDTFDDILPITQRLTANAATQSAQIVSELKAGKINIQQARAAIIASNAELERMMGAEVSAYAAQRGRTIDLTKAPLIDQPVVDPRGKPNTRGMFRQGIFGDVMSALGRATRTRTMGGAYSIETTKPQGLNSGGKVFYNNGDQVPGPNVNADVVPAMLTPGEFVIRRGVAQQDPEGMRALNDGQAMIVPINRNLGGIIPRYLAKSSIFGGFRSPGTRYFRQSRNRWDTTGSNPQPIAETGAGSIRYSDARLRRSNVYNDPKNKEYGITPTSKGNVLVHAFSPQYIRRLKALGYGPEDQIPVDVLRSMGIQVPGNTQYATLKALSTTWVKNSGSFNQRIKGAGSPASTPDGKGWKDAWSDVGWQDMQSLLIKLKDMGVPPAEAQAIAKIAAQRLNTLIKSRNGTMNENLWGKLVSSAEIGAMTRFSKSSSASSMFTANRGGMVPGYAVGGRVQAFTKSMIMKKLGAKWGKNDNDAGWSHKSASLGMGSKLFGRTGLRPYTQNLLYDALLETTSNTRPSGYFKAADGKLFRGIEPDQTDQMIRDAAEIVMRRHGKQLSPIDKKILKEQFTNWDIKQLKSTPGVRKAIFGFNKGGMVPGYMGGGMVQGYMGGGRVPGYNRGGGILASILLSQLGYYGGSALGSRLGGQNGSMIGGLLGSILTPGFGGGRGRVDGPSIEQRLGFPGRGPMLADQMGLTPSGPGMSVTPGLSRGRQSVFAGTRFASSINEMATGGGKLLPTLGKMLTGISRLNVALGAGVAAVGLGIKAWKNYNETQRLSAAAFGLTAESAEKAGLKYTNYNSKIKDSIDSIKLLLDKNKLVYESLQIAGTPFNITIQEYKKLQKEVKATMKDQIDLINATSSKDLNQVAIQLKEQFVAAGMSAEEASKKIYTLFKVSDKAAYAVSAVGSKGFGEIRNPETAAVSSIGTFNLAKDFQNTRDQAAQLFTALGAIESGVESIMKASEESARKDKTGKTKKLALYEAENKQLQMINSKVKEQQPIGQALLNNLIKQNPEWKAFASTTDTVVSLWQKLRIQAAGFTGDISKLNTEQVEQLYQLTVKVSNAVVSTNRENLLKKQYENLDKLTARQKELLKATKGQTVAQQIKDRDAIRAIDREIKKINERADARKKALQDQAAGESYQLELQKAQLEYQQNIATGDMTAAAQAKLRMRELISGRQNTLAMNQIDAERDAQVKPLEARKQAIQDKNEKLGDKAALAAESLDALNAKIARQTKEIDGVNGAMTRFQLALIANKDNIEKFKTTAEFKGLAADFLNEVKKAGLPTGTANLPDVVGGKLKPEDIANTSFNLIKSLDKGLSAALAKEGITTTGDIYINGKKLDIAGGGAQGMYRSKADSKQIQSNTYDSYLQKDGTLNAEGRRAIMKAFGLGSGQFFTYEGKTYKGNTGGSGDFLPAILQKAGGGVISGPGSGTSDSIPAMLSNGEYVIRAQAVQNVGVPLLDRINGMAMGGLATKYSVPSTTSNRVMMSGGGQAPLLGGNIVMQNTYNIPQSLSKEEVGRYIVDLEMKELKRIGYGRSK